MYDNLSRQWRVFYTLKKPHILYLHWISGILQSHLACIYRDYQVFWKVFFWVFYFFSICIQELNYISMNRCISFMLHDSPKQYYFLFSFIGRQFHASEAGFNLATWLRMTWNFRSSCFILRTAETTSTPCPVNAVLVTETRISLMVGKHFKNWATSPVTSNHIPLSLSIMWYTKSTHL